MNQAYNNQEQFDIKSMFTPMNILRASYYDPSAWSMTQGFRAVPFIGGNWKRAKSFYKGAEYFARHGQYGKATGMAFRGIFGGGSLQLGSKTLMKGNIWLKANLGLE